MNAYLGLRFENDACMKVRESKEFIQHLFKTFQCLTSILFYLVPRSRVHASVKMDL